MLSEIGDPNLSRGNKTFYYLESYYKFTLNTEKLK